MDEFEKNSIGNYNADTQNGSVYSLYDRNALPVEFSDVDIPNYHEITKAIRSIERAAYRRGVADVLGHVARFKSER